MIFPSHIDSSGSPVVETQLELYVKGDARETRDYFVKLVDISPGWEIKVDRDSIRWSTLVTLLLYDDRAQFEARAGAVHFIPFLVGNTSFAPNPGVATFELVHVKGFGDDEVLDLYRVELWQGREVSDLSVTATPNSVEATSGDSTTLVANVTNRGPNSVNQVALHIDVTDSENILFPSASTSGGVNPCRTLYFGKLLCELGALNPNQSATVNLNFSLSGSGSPIGGDYVHLQVSSTVYDPQSGNNNLTSTILISPSTTGPTQPQPPPPIVQPPPPTDASDREALIALYDATRGEIWYNNRNGNEVWDVDEVNSDISSWHGVTVNSAGRVTELNLYSNYLRYDRDHRNSLPPELGNLAYLWSLVLSSNDLRGRIPDAFGNLGNLVELLLDDNSLSGNIPASLGNLSNLESLDLSDNNLSGEIPAGLGNLPKMDVVYLGGNNLSGCVPAEWRRVQGDLEELGLPFCDVALNDLTISPGNGDIASVSAGGHHTCGVKRDGSAACWGWNRYGQATPPAGEFASVSADLGHTCGVRRDGSVACWGDDRQAQATPAAGEFASVSAGSLHTCGVRRDGSIACWGRNEYGQSTPAAGEFASVSAGYHYTCGVRRDGSVACWGLDRFGQATPPAGEFASVSTGYEHTCGLKRDGSVACWGWNRSGQATPLAGEFTSVNVGWWHTCGVGRDGSVACWGSNEYGQATRRGRGVRLHQRRRDPHLRGEAGRLLRLLGFERIWAGHAAGQCRVAHGCI